VAESAAAVVGESTGSYVAGMMNQAAQAMDDATKLGQDAMLAEQNAEALGMWNRRCLNSALDLALAVQKLPPQSSTCTIL
jgi:hypothetical protein